MRSPHLRQCAMMEQRYAVRGRRRTNSAQHLKYAWKMTLKNSAGYEYITALITVSRGNFRPVSHHISYPQVL